MFVSNFLVDLPTVNKIFSKANWSPWHKTSVGKVSNIFPKQLPRHRSLFGQPVPSIQIVGSGSEWSKVKRKGSFRFSPTSVLYTGGFERVWLSLTDRKIELFTQTLKVLLNIK